MVVTLYWLDASYRRHRKVATKCKDTETDMKELSKLNTGINLDLQVVVTKSKQAGGITK